MIDAILLLIIGLAILAVGIWYAPAKFKALAVIVGVVAVGVAAVYPGYGIWAEDITPTVPAALVGATIDVTPSNGSYDPGAANVCTQTVDDDEEGTTVQIMVDKSLDTFQANYTSFNFSLNPRAPPTATADDLITVYFSVNEDFKYGGEPIFYETSNVMQAVWSIDDSEDTANYAGSHTMLYTDTDWVELRCILDGKGSDTFGSEIDTVGESVDFDINFWILGPTGAKIWTWTYTVDLICIRASD